MRGLTVGVTDALSAVPPYVVEQRLFVRAKRPLIEFWTSASFEHRICDHD
jgi:hypothetical protein